VNTRIKHNVVLVNYFSFDHRAGQARFRFGGNIPLIGISTWGSVANREELEVKPDSFNYGYITRKPVEYKEYDIPEEKQRGMAHLEQNHSHFILVLFT
jgi:hypothetical protein